MEDARRIAPLIAAKPPRADSATLMASAPVEKHATTEDFAALAP
jgi:hypothetical protein